MHYSRTTSRQAPQTLEERSTGPPSQEGEEEEEADRASKQAGVAAVKGPQHGGGKGRRAKDPWASWVARSKRGWEGWQQSGKDSSRDDLDAEVKNLRECLFLLQKLALRHEDFLAVLRPEMCYGVFMKLNFPPSVVPVDLCCAERLARKGKGRPGLHYTSDEGDVTAMIHMFYPNWLKSFPEGGG